MSAEERLADCPEAGSLIYLKLGGSLITDKRTPERARLDVIARLAAEIAAAREGDPTLQLVVGHGSGSFGHVAGRQYGTRDGVDSSQGWYGFAVTADAAARLNRLVVSALLAAGVPAWTIQPSAMLFCEDGRVLESPATPVAQALANGLVPVVHGDVALDSVRGGTIVSTEEVFEWLAQQLPPARLILLGEVDGIFSADPKTDPAAVRIPLLTPEGLHAIEAGLSGSHGVDVTGGMVAKVTQSMRLVERWPTLEIVVAGGLVNGNLRDLLLGRSTDSGTRIRRTAE